MNGDSLTKASSRHSMVCEAKIKKNPLKINKNRKSKGVLLEKILIIYLKCNAVKELGQGGKKMFVFWGKDPS